MKTRESGMPPEEMWQQFFDPSAVLSTLRLSPTVRDIVDFGCGFGTFTIPAAQIVQGTVFAFDIDPEMVAATRAKANALGLHNVDARQRDFVADGTALPDQSVDYAMLFNILHAEDPLILLREAHRILRPAATLAIIHWIYDPAHRLGQTSPLLPHPPGPHPPSPLPLRPPPHALNEWQSDNSPPGSFD